MKAPLATLAAAVLVAVAPPAEAAGSDTRAQVQAWRRANEKAVVGELVDLMALPNVATDQAAIERNAEHLERIVRRRGFTTRRLSAGPGTPPSIYAELRTPGARRTVVYYAHFDGQPVDQEGWLSDPWTPVMRDGPPGRPGLRTVDWRAAPALDPEWRLYGRSASDDKAPIVMLLAALDALKASGRRPSVNVKLFLEGEEEQGSPHLVRILEQNRELLRSDLWILLDGPMHQSRRMQVYLGARGATGLELTVYGPARPLHSGHYGNWAPNPAVMAAHLVADMRDEEGRILIPGFYDDVRPLTAAERAALAALPDVETDLRRELALGRTEGGERLLDSVMRPSLNVRGIQSGGAGRAAANLVPTEAHVSIDFRLVPGQTPEGVRRRVEDHLRARGWTVVQQEPDLAARRAAPRLVWARWNLGYGAARTDVALPESRAVIATVNRTLGAPSVVIPMLGGSVPIAMIVDTLGVPVVGVPTVNHDNNQHGANENLRLQNLWDGIEVCAGLLADLRW